MIASQINRQNMFLQNVFWQKGYDRRVNPIRMTRLLLNAIPVLKSVHRHVTEGVCVSELPLGYESTNQHGTPRAAFMSHSAHYTGGLVLATLLQGIPWSGAHGCNDDRSDELW